MSRDREPDVKRAVRPRNAATLILVRDRATEPRLLMGRRHSGHDFMANKWVFPGGRVHPGDYRAPAASELQISVATALADHAPGPLGRALALAAIRETFEEVGLLLAQAGGWARSRGVWRDFLATGMRPHLAALSFIGRAITPPSRHKRFDARFFMADADALLSLEPGPGCGELTETAWFSLDEARTLNLPTITRFMIEEVAARLSGDTQRPVFFPHWQQEMASRAPD